MQLKGSPCEHRVQQHAKAPHIAGGIITLLLEDLWCHKVGGVAWRHEQAIFRTQLFRKSKVADAKAGWRPGGVCVEDVGGFQVSVHHLAGRMIGSIISHEGPPH